MMTNNGVDDGEAGDWSNRHHHRKGFIDPHHFPVKVGGGGGERVAAAAAAATRVTSLHLLHLDAWTNGMSHPIRIIMDF